MSRQSWSMRRAAFGAAIVPMIAFAAPRAQAPGDVQSLAATNQVVVPFEHNARQNALMIRATSTTVPRCSCSTPARGTASSAVRLRACRRKI